MILVGFRLLNCRWVALFLHQLTLFLVFGLLLQIMSTGEEDSKEEKIN
jgi:hypothetical protein